MTTNTTLDSTNVRSVSDEGKGLCLVTLETPFANADYSVVAGSNCSGVLNTTLSMTMATASLLSENETMLRGWTTDGSGRSYDCPRMTAIWFSTAE
jgi:hypothetical protein